MSTSLFSMSVSPLRPCKLFHQYHLYRFHRYALVCDICFSLSDLLCFFTFLHRACEVFALRTNFISICHGTWESYKYLKQKIISRLLINVPGIYLTVKKCEWMTSKNSWILLKSLFFFLMDKVSFTMGLKGTPRLWETGIDKEFQARKSLQTLMSKVCGEQEERDGHWL